MFDLKTPQRDAEFGAALRRQNFDASSKQVGQQGMCASWK